MAYGVLSKVFSWGPHEHRQIQNIGVVDPLSVHHSSSFTWHTLKVVSEEMIPGTDHLGG